MNDLTVKNLGPIRSAKVTFGDLTVLAAPQASGKSLFLQTLKLVSDAGAIKNDLKTENLWSKGWSAFLAAYLGRGMEAVWNGSTEVRVDHKTWGERQWNAARKTERIHRRGVELHVPQHRLYETHVRAVF